MKNMLSEQEKELLRIEKNVKKEQRREEKAKKRKALYEKIFYRDEKVDLSVAQDGSDIRVLKKRNWVLPAIIFVSIAFLFVISLLSMTKGKIRFNWEGISYILSSLFRPKHNSTNDWNGWWTYMFETAVPTIWRTIEMCFLASVVGAILSIPIYFLSARNIAKHAYIYEPVRVVNTFLRTIPMLLYALLFLKVWGIGSLPGVAAMVVFTLGIMYQMMYEYIETLEMSPYEAIQAAGGRSLQNVRLGLHPSIKPMFFANLLYTFEINIRASVILGYVGAGGYGLQLDMLTGNENYDKVGALLVPLFVVVILLQITTNLVSRKLK